MSPWPLSSRTPELQQVQRLLDDGHGAILAGPSGIGKTRLARELRTRWTDGEVLWFAATPALQGIPFGVFASHVDDMHSSPGDTTGVLYHLGRRLTGSFLIVDDAHLLDEGSATVVHQLAVAGRTRILLTVRPQEDPPEEIVRLWRDGYAERVDLTPFDLTGVRTVLKAVLGAPVDVLTAERLRAWTGGNALHLRELTEAGLTSGRLRQEESVWWWAGDPVISGGLAEIIDARLRGLGPKARRAMAAAALADPADPVLLTELADADAVAQLRTAGLLTEQDGLRPVHPVYREPALGLIPPSELNELRLQLAAHWSDTANTALSLRAAVLRLDAGEHLDDEALLTAADDALGLLDAKLAERLAGRASDSARRSDLLARAAINSGRPARAEELLAVVDLTTLDLPTAEALTSTYACSLLDQGRAVEALALLDRSPVRTPRTSAYRVLALNVDARHTEAAAVFDAEVGPHLGERSPEVLATAALAAGASLSELGRPADALVRVRAALSVLPHRHPESLLPRLMETEALCALGRFDEGSLGAEEMHAWGLETHWSPATGCGLAYLGIIAAARGSYNEAAGYMRDAVAATHELNLLDVRRRRLSLLATYEATAGRLDSARATLDRVPRRDREYAGELRTGAEALLLACSGAVLEARTRLVAIADEAVAEQRPGRGMGALHLLARLGRAAEAARRLESCAGADSPVWHAYAAHIRALDGRSPSALTAASEAFEGIQLYHLAAEAADMAASLAPDRRTAAAARSRRDVLLAACDTGPLPWWPMTRKHDLTVREAEIARLAATGLTNKDIAARLVLSVRTVENHLRQAYLKLGARGRADLADRI